MQAIPFLSLRRNFHHPGYLLLAFMAVVWFSLTAQGDGTVTSCTESNLDYALAGGGTVTFTCNGTINITTTKLIYYDTVFDGSGHTVTINGQNSVQLFNVNSGVNLTLLNLTLADGKTTTNGGAIYNEGTLIASN